MLSIRIKDQTPSFCFKGHSVEEENRNHDDGWKAGKRRVHEGKQLRWIKKSSFLNKESQEAKKQEVDVKDFTSLS